MVDSREVDLILSRLKKDECDEWIDMPCNCECQQDDDVSDSQIAVILVLGGLTYRGIGWWYTSYIDILEEFREALADPNVKVIVFDIDSLGGEVAGVFDLVDEIYQARGQKPIFAVANECALSAAYAIASAADRVFLSRTGSVGSVGVIAIAMDQVGFDADMGVKYTAVYAGERKNDFNPHEALTKTAKDILQGSVDTFYELFVNTVARNRRMAPDAVRSTQAMTYSGMDAVNIGLADTVMAWDEVIQDVATKYIGDSIMKMEDLGAGLSVLMTENKQAVEDILKTAGFQPETAVQETIKDVAAKEIAAKLSGAAQGAQDAIKAASDILDICMIGGRPEMAKDLILKGVSLEDAKAQVLAAKAESGKEIISTVSALGLGEVNPLIADAMARAEAVKK